MTEDAKPGRLRIAYLCDFSPLDRNLYSGGNARMFDALCRHGGEVSILDPGWGPVDAIRRLILRLPEALNIRLRWRAHLLLSPLIARHVERQLQAGQFDVLFCAYSFQSLAGIRVPPGLVTAHTSDATPTIYKKSVIGRRFGSYLRLSRLADPLIRRAEGRVFRRADLLLWPSDWLRNEVERTFGLDPGRSRVVPWGANIDRIARGARPPPLRSGAPINFLFLGRNWDAKGGPIALSILTLLRERGHDARLTVIGSDPAEARGHPAVTIHPGLDKAVPSELATLDHALASAHFLVMPSLESYGFAYCEASAHGLPSLCLRVGGVPVQDGINGHALPLGSPPADYVSLVEAYLADPSRYDQLRQSTRRLYETDLNWDTWGTRVTALLAEAVARRRAAPDLSAQSPAAPPRPSAEEHADPLPGTG